MGFWRQVGCVWEVDHLKFFGNPHPPTRNADIFCVSDEVLDKGTDDWS